jgi:hypothetical protein
MLYEDNAGIADRHRFPMPSRTGVFSPSSWWVFAKELGGIDDFGAVPQKPLKPYQTLIILPYGKKYLPYLHIMCV